MREAMNKFKSIKENAPAYFIFVILATIYWYFLQNPLQKPAVLRVTYTAENGETLPAPFIDTVYVYSRSTFLGETFSLPEEVKLPAETYYARDKEQKLKEVLRRDYGVRLRSSQWEWKSGRPADSLAVLPVKTLAEGSSPPGYIWETEQIRPEKVWVYGPADTLKRMHEVIAKMQLPEPGARGPVKASVELPARVHAVPPEVQVEGKWMPFVMKEAKISLDTRDENLKNYMFIPSQVTVRYKQLPAGTGDPSGDWKIGVRERREGDSLYFEPVILSVPPGVRDVQVEPARIDYFIVHEN